MPRSPLRLYESLLACVDGTDERERVAAVRGALREERVPEELRSLLDRERIGAGYVLRHLLSIQRFAPDVRAALEAGLPLGVARLVNGLTDAEVRARVLEPLTSAGPHRGALLGKGVARDIERAVRATMAAEPPRLAGAAATEAGWMLADAERAPRRTLRGSAWTFPAPTSRRRRGAEPLHPILIEGLLERILPRGGRLVDVTAGIGSFALVGRRHGVETWSGDLQPSAPFVRRADARTLLADAHPGLSEGAADALVVHPPTYPTWAKQVEPSSLDAYADAVGEMVAGSLAVVRPGGSVMLVTRPVRSKDEVWLTTSHLAQGLLDLDLRLRDYVVAVAEDGSEDWHVLIARMSMTRR